jgi:hypothetical protein
MPFTVSHAAAVLPLRRTRLPWSALVIGSFGPDFEYFLRIEYTSRAWHYWPDVLIYCLPFTIFLYFLFHGLIQAPMTRLLPDGIQRRLHFANPYPRTLGGVAMLLAALVLGIATHLVWDAITHAYSWPWRHFAILRALLFKSHVTGEVYGFELAQMLSTAGGLLILFVFFVVWYRRTPETAAAGTMSSPKRLGICAGLVVVAFAGGLYTAHSRLRPKDFDFPLLLVISSISWFLWEVVAYSVVTQLLGKRR